MGPLWYRGMVMDYKTYYKKQSRKAFDKVLDHFAAQKVIIGHTVVDRVSTDYDDRLIKIDVKHGKEKNSTKTQGLLWETDKWWVVDGAGGKKAL